MEINCLKDLRSYNQFIGNPLIAISLEPTIIIVVGNDIDELADSATRCIPESISLKRVVFLSKGIYVKNSIAEVVVQDSISEENLKKAPFNLIDTLEKFYLKTNIDSTLWAK